MACLVSTLIQMELCVCSMIKAPHDTDGLLLMTILSSDTAIKRKEKNASSWCTNAVLLLKNTSRLWSSEEETPRQIQEALKEKKRKNSRYGPSGTNIKHDYSHNLPTGVECMLIFTKRSSPSRTGGLIRLNPSKFPKPCEFLPKHHYSPWFGAARV